MNKVELKAKREALINRYSRLINKIVDSKVNNENLYKAKVIGDYLEKDTLNQVTLDLIDRDMQKLFDEC